MRNDGQSEVYGRAESDGSDVPQGYCREDCFIYRFSLDSAGGLPNLLTLTLANTGETVCVTYAEIDVTP